MGGKEEILGFYWEKDSLSWFCEEKGGEISFPFSSFQSEQLSRFAEESALLKKNVFIALPDESFEFHNIPLPPLPDSFLKGEGLALLIQKELEKDRSEVRINYRIQNGREGKTLYLLAYPDKEALALEAAFKEAGLILGKIFPSSTALSSLLPGEGRKALCHFQEEEGRLVITDHGFPLFAAEFELADPLKMESQLNRLVRAYEVQEETPFPKTIYAPALAREVVELFSKIGLNLARIPSYQGGEKQAFALGAASRLEEGWPNLLEDQPLSKGGWKKILAATGAALILLVALFYFFFPKPQPVHETFIQPKHIVAKKTLKHVKPPVLEPIFEALSAIGKQIDPSVLFDEVQEKDGTLTASGEALLSTSIPFLVGELNEEEDSSTKAIQSARIISLAKKKDGYLFKIQIKLAQNQDEEAFSPTHLDAPLGEVQEFIFSKIAEMGGTPLSFSNEASTTGENEQTTDTTPKEFPLQAKIAGNAQTLEKILALLESWSPGLKVNEMQMSYSSDAKAVVLDVTTTVKPDFVDSAKRVRPIHLTTALRFRVKRSKEVTGSFSEKQNPLKGITFKGTFQIGDSITAILDDGSLYHFAKAGEKVNGFTIANISPGEIILKKGKSSEALSLEPPVNEKSIRIPENTPSHEPGY